VTGLFMIESEKTEVRRRKVDHGWADWHGFRPEQSGFAKLRPDESHLSRARSAKLAKGRSKIAGRPLPPRSAELNPAAGSVLVHGPDTTFQSNVLVVDVVHVATCQQKSLWQGNA
jgi:hypothetical protein